MKLDKAMKAGNGNLRLGLLRVDVLQKSHRGEEEHTHNIKNVLNFLKSYSM